MQRWDFAIVGGGAAGLSLAHALVKEGFDGNSILIIDKDAKVQNDRTWSFWTCVPGPFDSIRRASWDELFFITPEINLRLPLAPYRYQTIQGIDFYQFVRRELERHPSVRSIQAVVDRVEDGEEEARIFAGGEEFRATWVFDSRFSPEDLQKVKNSRVLQQHFTGWEVETDTPVFDPTAFTLFDLRVPQPEGLAFTYVLPYSDRRALVEYTLFSKNRLPEDEYRHAIRHYLQEQLGLKQWTIVDEETGVIPMTDAVFQRRRGKRILAIGTAGGRVKPSTGFAFARIQRDTQNIIRSLKRDGTPFHLPRPSRRFHYYDTLLLDLLERSDPDLRRAFAMMFEFNPVRRILRFMDEESTLGEDALILASMPPLPFLTAAFRKLLADLRNR